MYGDFICDPPNYSLERVCAVLNNKPSFHSILYVMPCHNLRAASVILWAIWTSSSSPSGVNHSLQQISYCEGFLYLIKFKRSRIRCQVFFLLKVHCCLHSIHLYETMLHVVRLAVIANFLVEFWPLFLIIKSWNVY